MRRGRPWFDAASLSVIGARKNQEDSEAHFVLPPPPGGSDERLIVVLADGMGGHEAGEVASRLAVDAFLSTASDNRKEASEDILALGLRIASRVVIEKARDDAALNEMGTTLTAAIFEMQAGAPSLRWISVGDSPLWKAGVDGTVARLNADHSLAGELEAEVKVGIISAQDASNDPRRSQSNVLKHALTAAGLDFYDADFQRDPLILRADDRVIVASDGIETLSESELGELACRHAKDDARTQARAILDAVLQAEVQHQDNATLALVRFAIDGGADRG